MLLEMSAVTSTGSSHPISRHTQPSWTCPSQSRGYLVGPRRCLHRLPPLATDSRPLLDALGVPKGSGSAWQDSLLPCALQWGSCTGIPSEPHGGLGIPHSHRPVSSLPARESSQFFSQNLKLCSPCGHSKWVACAQVLCILP